MKQLKAENKKQSNELKELEDKKKEQMKQKKFMAMLATEQSNRIATATVQQ